MPPPGAKTPPPREFSPPRGGGFFSLPLPVSVPTVCPLFFGRRSASFLWLTLRSLFPLTLRLLFSADCLPAFPCRRSACFSLADAPSTFLRLTLRLLFPADAPPLLDAPFFSYPVLRLIRKSVRRIFPARVRSRHIFTIFVRGGECAAAQALRRRAAGAANGMQIKTPYYVFS